MTQTNPIFTVDLLPKLDEKLIEVLQSLSPQDWEKQSIAPLWRVKDIAVHLLDGNIRALSMLRDQYFGVIPESINSYQDLLDYLNKLNHDWVTAMKRVSPKIIIELLASTGKEYCEYLKTLEPFEAATFSVAWAGEEQSSNWFHIAREYTEKWHHQQQIRFAVGQTAELYSKEFYFPYLETSMRALPHHYRNVEASKGEVIKFSVSGDGGGDWFIEFDGKKWYLVPDPSQKPVTEVTIEGDIAWRIFTKGINKQRAAKQISIKGNQLFGEKILDMLAVMA